MQQDVVEWKATLLYGTSSLSLEPSRKGEQARHGVMQRCDRLRGKEGVERFCDVNKSGTGCMTEYQHRMTEQVAAAFEKTLAMNGKEGLDERLGWSQSSDGRRAAMVAEQRW